MEFIKAAVSSKGVSSSGSSKLPVFHNGLNWDVQGEICPLKRCCNFGASAKWVLLMAVCALFGCKTVTHYLFPTKVCPNIEKACNSWGFLKWSALGFYRTSRFASGFTPLQPKPLDFIIDIERAKGKTPELLAEIWDDIRFYFACDSVCVRFKNI